MKEIVSTVTSKGQITIPMEVRRHLGIGEGDKVVFVIDDDGLVHLRRVKYPTIASISGIAGSLDRPLTWEEMREAAREDQVVERYRKKHLDNA